MTILFIIKLVLLGTLIYGIIKNFKTIILAALLLFLVFYLLGFIDLAHLI